MNDECFKTVELCTLFNFIYHHVLYYVPLPPFFLPLPSLILLRFHMMINALKLLSCAPSLISFIIMFCTMSPFPHSFSPFPPLLYLDYKPSWALIRLEIVGYNKLMSLASKIHKNTMITLYPYLNKIV